MAAELAGRLEPIVAAAVTGAGFDLDGLEVQQAGRRKLVKAVVDGEDGIGLDEVAKISRAVSEVLDENEHLLAGAYTLEVTSPGLDRPLTLPRHWRRARRRQVRITPVEGEAYLGRVGKAGEDSVRVLVKGELVDLAYTEVARAVIEIEFKQPPAAELELLGEADGTEDTVAGTDGDENDSKEESR